MVAVFKEEYKKLLVNRSNTKLLTVNSPTNNKQTKKEYHKDFIEMVNSYAHIFSGLGTVLSGNLQRHFYKLYMTDKDKVRQETLKIDIQFLKDTFHIMKVNFNENTSINQALFLNRLAEALGLNLADFSLHFDLNYNKLRAQLLNTQPNDLAELRLKSTGLKITFFTWKQLREKIFPNIDQERPYFSIAKIQVEQYYKNDSDFQAAANPIIEGYAKKYFQRAQLKKSDTSYEACRLAAKKYLIEESAMLFVLKELNYDLATYPGALNDALQYLVDKCFKNNYMPWLEYSFKDKPLKNNSDHQKIKQIEQNHSTWSDIIIGDLTLFGLAEKAIRPTFLLNCIIFMARYKQNILEGNLFSPKIGYYNQGLARSDNRSLSEEDFYNSILLRIKHLKLSDETIWPDFYAAFILFIVEFNQLTTQEHNVQVQTEQDTKTNLYLQFQP